MLDSIDAYRTPNSPLLRSSIARLNGGIEQSSSLKDGDIQVFKVEGSVTDTFTCRLVSGNGEVDLFMNDSGDFEGFDCQEESDATEKACTVGPGMKAAYAIVYAKVDSPGFQITCDI